MLAAQLKSHVETVLAQPMAHQRLHERIEAFAAEGGTTLGPNDNEGLSAFCKG
jgi:hypothetical protein